MDVSSFMECMIERCAVVLSFSSSRKQAHRTTKNIFPSTEITTERYKTYTVSI